MEAEPTRLSRVSASDPRTEFLVVHEPLEQTTHYAAPLGEGRCFPVLLCLDSTLNLVLNQVFVVGQHGLQVQAGGGVKGSDVTSSRKGQGRHNLRVRKVGFDRGIGNG